MTTQQTPVPPIDSDVDLPVPAQRRRRSWDPGVLAAIAAGGVLGAEARYGMSLLLPHHPGQWPWATWLTNVSGCFLIGVLMVVITELTSPHRLVRPFLGVGVLGGFTTFSTFAVDAQTLLAGGHRATALAYLAGTVLAAVAAAALGMTLTRRATAGRRAASGGSPR
jgi:CrcB protein